MKQLIVYIRKVNRLHYIATHQAGSMHAKSCGVIVNGNHTDIVLNFYTNRTFLVISQYKKLGSLVTVTKEAALREFNNDNTYTTKVIFGQDDPEIHAAARYIAEQLDTDKSLLISICLKDYEVSTLRTIVKAIQKVKSH